ncbi:hypothetical protein J6590_085840 [Homalodisca vitripennis]|nr:hypothetical protein J6590_085840 [Homalodisca vitripennis]
MQYKQLHVDHTPEIGISATLTGCYVCQLNCAGRRDAVCSDGNINSCMSITRQRLGLVLHRRAVMSVNSTVLDDETRATLTGRYVCQRNCAGRRDAVCSDGNINSCMSITRQRLGLVLHRRAVMSVNSTVLDDETRCVVMAI